MTTEHKGHTMEVNRIDNTGAGYEYEFALEIDGEQVKTASQLERDGYSFEEVNNWTNALRRFGRAYIEGMEA